MDQQDLSGANRIAWSYEGYYDVWCRYTGTPGALAAKARSDPWAEIKPRYRHYLGDVKGKRIANLLGSIGRKAVSLALLGAEVTVVDISETNARFARELAAAAGVSVEYVITDVLELDMQRYSECFHIVLMEGGILHYFVDLAPLARLVHDLLQPGGRMVLDDMHPLGRCLDLEGSEPRFTVDYFDPNTGESYLPLVKFMPTSEQAAFPKTAFRRWTMGQIVTAFAQAGLRVEHLDERPGPSHPRLPDLFTLVASKT